MRSLRPLAFWAGIAPAVFFVLLPLALVPLYVLGPCLNETRPAQVFALVATLGVSLVVWWLWRIYQGDPPREPRVPSRTVIAISSVVIALQITAIMRAPRQGTLVDRPWLVEPVFVDYPCEARSALVEGAVRFDLIVEQSGVISSHEILESPHPSFTSAVEAAVAEFRIDVPRLEADSFPYRKKLRIEFVLQP